MIHSVHPPARVHSRAHTGRHWPLPSASNAEYQVGILACREEGQAAYGKAHVEVTRLQALT